MLTTRPLTCQECGCPAPAAAPGWRAEIAEDSDDGEPAIVVLYCPGCWEAEFGTRDT